MNKRQIIDRKTEYYTFVADINLCWQILACKIRKLFLPNATEIGSNLVPRHGLGTGHLFSSISSQSWQWNFIAPACVVLWDLVVLHSFWAIPGGQTSACSPICIIYQNIISILVPCLPGGRAGKHGTAPLLFPNLHIFPCFSIPLVCGNLLVVWVKSFCFHVSSNHFV